MSRTKDLLEDKGYFPSSEKVVCDDCVGDYTLREIIRQNAEATACDFCGRSSTAWIAAPLDVVVEAILEGLKQEWGDPDNECVPFESREGGYQARLYTTWEILAYEEPFTDCDELTDEVGRLLSDFTWVGRPFFGLKRRDALAFGWEEFVDAIKHETRFLFFPESQDPWDRFSDEVKPAEMLDRLGEVVNELGLTKRLPAGTNLIRARVHDKSEHPITAAELGAHTKSTCRSSNRMSPAGIPMFYAALDEGTAMAEVSGTLAPTDVVTIGTWSTLRDLNLIDLTQLPLVPSLYDDLNRELRDAIIFLHQFVADFAKPIQKDGREHVEYVPTQVVTEYFRYRFRDAEGSPVQGILYPSSRMDGNVSCVLFFDGTNCTDPVAGSIYPINSVVMLEPSTIHTIRPGT